MGKTRRREVHVQEAEALCARMDQNGDRVIEWDELKTFMIEFLRENRRGKGPSV